MASFKLYLDTRSSRKDGTFPLKIAVTHKRSFLVNLKVYTTPQLFIDGQVHIPGNPSRQKSINNYIRSRLSQVENTLNRLRVLGTLPEISDAALKRMFTTETTGGDDEPRPQLLINHWRKFVARKQPGGRRIYDHTESRLRAYCDLDSLPFSAVTVSWLHDFDRWLSGTSSVNTRSIHMRNIRSVFNSAIDEDVIDQGLYPFRKFRIKSERTRKRSLTVEQLRTLRDFPCEEHQQKYRDMFMLIFYLIGINVTDLASLEGINEGRIEYRRQKTGKDYSIKVEPEALAIIEKYRGESRLLNIADTYSDHRNYLHRLNDNLKRIGEVKIVERKAGRGLGKKEYKGLFPELSTYWARHTWATIAAGLDIPKETIAAALGHGGNTVTDIYIDFDTRKIDQANRKVIDYLNFDIK